MSRVSSFAPLEPASARLLILGSMPGLASLRAAEYYAHPHNRFWRYMQTLFGVPADADYALRVQALLAQGVALWDVLKHCERPGSLDASIVRGTETANDFAALLARQPQLRAIAFNGRAAETAFRRQALPTLKPALGNIRLIVLPSTSPANAALNDTHKLAAWSVLSEFRRRQ